LQKLVRLAINVHRIRLVIIIIRDSPPRDEDAEKYGEPSVSLLRQGKFLDHILPRDIERRHITLPHTSAFSGKEVLANVTREFEDAPGRALLVSTALNRVVRSATVYEELRGAIERGGYMALSFMWDTNTLVNPPEAMVLPAGE